MKSVKAKRFYYLLKEEELLKIVVVSFPTNIQEEKIKASNLSV